ncbi:hypothetical protein UFOVP1360_50 [uncultured Caudovirales phage]|uniref:Uncharacterized protein n=1 Tax=uncultured Caudovirales phage TaxID=2100421 RepID=A0A6J5RUZ6_9CAUD|nr:hypothetical protein UFOVP1360_50 [uncultured Caudovirales phage]
MDYKAGDTLIVQGSGGAVNPHDVPADGTWQRKQFDTLVERGEYTILDSAGDPVPAQAPKLTPENEDDFVPVGTVSEVAAWVHTGAVDGDTETDPADGWHERATRALEAEMSPGGESRSSLVKLLTKVVGVAPVAE